MVEVELEVTGEEGTDGEWREDGEGVSGERRERGV